VNASDIACSISSDLMSSHSRFKPAGGTKTTCSAEDNTAQQNHKLEHAAEIPFWSPTSVLWRNRAKVKRNIADHFGTLATAAKPFSDGWSSAVRNVPLDGEAEMWHATCRTVSVLA